MHLNWFSPLPPARTDIANFTARVAALLAQRFSLTFWTGAKTESPKFRDRVLAANLRARRQARMDIEWAH